VSNLHNWPASSYSILDIVQKEYFGKNILVTGGASFIGSHLVDALLGIGCKVRIIDDLSSGLVENLDLSNPNLDFIKGDILTLNNVSALFSDMDMVFHLAAIHGGRGYIETKQRDILRNIAIDNTVFNATVLNNIPKITYASSACAYPLDLQASADIRHQLSENNSGAFNRGIANPDGLYGWTKLTGEFQLESYIKCSNTIGRAARIFTAYGERENESHAAIALMARALLRMDPFLIWGNGKQTRNFTYVTDTVAGLLSTIIFRPSEKYAIINIGTSRHTSVYDFAHLIFDSLNWHPEKLNFRHDKPTGVASRSSDNKIIKDEIGWEPAVGLNEGISRTLAWYSNKKDRPKTIDELESLLESR
jgi:nucleoside-diphosphate-sugar epimerase